MFRQLQQVQAQREEAEALFWSLVSRYETPLDPTWQGEFATDPFGDLATIPPVPRRSGLSNEQSEILYRELDTAREEASLLQEENRSLSSTNQELLWRIDTLERERTTPPSIPPPSEEAIDSIRQEVIGELSKKFSEEFSKKEQDLTTRTAELIRTSNQLRRALIDLELTRTQIEEDSEEISALRRRLEAAALAIDNLQKQLAQARSSSKSIRPTSDRQETLERQVIEWANKAHAQEVTANTALQEIRQLQALVVCTALQLGQTLEPQMTNPLSIISSGLRVSLDPPPLSEEKLQDLSLKIFPFIDHPSQPHYNIEESPPHRSPVGSSPPPPSSPPSQYSSLRRNQTMGWSPAMQESLPPPTQKAERNRTVLGFEASPEQVTQQERMIQSPGGKNPRSR